jgi:hypothetical protein
MRFVLIRRKAADLSALILGHAIPHAAPPRARWKAGDVSAGRTGVRTLHESGSDRPHPRGRMNATVPRRIRESRTRHVRSRNHPPTGRSGRRAGAVRRQVW